MFIYNVFLTFMAKRLINGFIKHFKNILLQMVFVPIIFYPLPNVSFQMFAKPKNVYWDMMKIDLKRCNLIIVFVFSLF